jgi:hypothetical protein
LGDVDLAETGEECIVTPLHLHEASALVGQQHKRSDMHASISLSKEAPQKKAL